MDGIKSAFHAVDVEPDRHSSIEAGRHGGRKGVSDKVSVHLGSVILAVMVARQTPRAPFSAGRPNRSDRQYKNAMTDPDPFSAVPARQDTPSTRVRPVRAITAAVLVLVWSLFTASREAEAASDDRNAGESIARAERSSQFIRVVHENLRSIVETEFRIFRNYDWSSATVHFRAAASREFGHILFVQRDAGAREPLANPAAAAFDVNGSFSTVPAAMRSFRVLTLKANLGLYDPKDHWQRRVVHIIIPIAPVIIVAAQAVMNRVAFTSQSKPRQFSARVRLRLRPSRRF